ncbi:MAG TPA: hypothetical protein VN040_14110 [Pseudosphingobacterium sp.]|nr:hypothetical protein [Pseudosphingobacterium sp.]
MLEKITWVTFFLFLLGSAAIYYLVIGYVFYREDFKKRFQSKNNDEQGQLYEEEPGAIEKEEEEPEEYESAFNELQLVVNEIRYGILEKAGSGASKEGLMDQLKQRLASYEGLREPAFRTALTNFIADQAESICGVSFSEDELEEEWSKLLR